MDLENPLRHNNCEVKYSIAQGGCSASLSGLQGDEEEVRTQH